jgi:NlpC/P60 family
MAVNELAVAAGVGAAILVYVGTTGKSFKDAIDDIIQGKSPVNAAKVNQIEAGSYSGTSTTPGYGGPLSGTNIARDALSYQGHPYAYGGAPGTNGQSPWDCSAFVNWVLGHDFGLTLPGPVSNYTGATHGPTTLAYLVWSGAKTIPYSQAQAGDLAVWQTHMGIFVNSVEMISAENAQVGTIVSPVQGNVSGEVLVVRRLQGLLNSTVSPTYAPTPTGEEPVDEQYTEIG